jgi:hypothetical protein
VLVAAVNAQERPLPNPQQFFDATRANLDRSQSLQASYAYRERRRELHTNPFGRPGQRHGHRGVRGDAAARRRRVAHPGGA